MSEFLMEYAIYRELFQVIFLISIGLYVGSLILKKLMDRYWKDDDEETGTS